VRRDMQHRKKARLSVKGRRTNSCIAAGGSAACWTRAALSRRLGAPRGLFTHERDRDARSSDYFAVMSPRAGEEHEREATTRVDSTLPRLGAPAKNHMTALARPPAYSIIISRDHGDFPISYHGYHGPWAGYHGIQISYHVS